MRSTRHRFQVVATPGQGQSLEEKVMVKQQNKTGREKRRSRGARQCPEDSGVSDAEDEGPRSRANASK